MHIVIVGQVSIDENISEYARYIGAGGPPIFMERIFRQLPGTNVMIVSPYGKDYLRYLDGVTIYPQKPVSATTLTYKNISHGNSRQQMAFNRNEAKPIVINADIKKILQTADILIVAPILPNFSRAYVQKLISLVRPGAITLLVAQGYFRHVKRDGTVVPRRFVEAEAILPLFDFVTLSSEDYPDMRSLARRWVKNTDATMLMTQGDKGATIFQRSRMTQVPTKVIPVDKIVDSVGSGDIFSAGFIYEYARTKEVVGAVRFANKLAGTCLAFRPDHIRFDYRKLSLS